METSGAILQYFTCTLLTMLEGHMLEDIIFGIAKFQEEIGKILPPWYLLLKLPWAKVSMHRRMQAKVTMRLPVVRMLVSFENDELKFRIMYGMDIILYLKETLLTYGFDPYYLHAPSYFI